eukprot:Transcript_8904.p1 GENE.Transcript_8904~~Transcript_8904.p1  ORF type:complete len:421 (+),score=104.93 Transcript_8904:56-1318(+)
MLRVNLLRCSGSSIKALRCATVDSYAGSRRCYAQGSRFSKTKKRVEVLEREPEPPQGSIFGSSQQGQQGFQQGFQQAPQASSSFPSYVDQREREREQQTGSQWENLSSGVVAHMQKVYGTLATGIGIAAGSALFAMATPVVGSVHPFILGLAPMVPIMGLYYTSKHTHSATMRTGLFAAATGLSGVAMAPLLKFALAVNPVVVPQALLITTAMFGTMTALSLMAKPGATLRWGVPLAGGMFMLMGCGIATMFVPVTSAWYPLLHNVYLYGGLGLFTLYIAYDTQKMIDEYEMGEDDHLKHALDLFIDFKARAHMRRAAPCRRVGPCAPHAVPHSLVAPRACCLLAPPPHQLLRAADHLLARTSPPPGARRLRCAGPRGRAAARGRTCSSAGGVFFESGRRWCEADASWFLVCHGSFQCIL